FAAARHANAQPHVSHLGPLRPAVIVLTPGASPACPAPNMQIAREVIAVLSPRPPLLEVVGGDHHDALIVPIAPQQLSRKAKERRVRDAVVLDDDAFFDMLEEPGDGLADRILA